ncbi:hypothetical protein LEP1GSC062_0537 [Leptospira alexanderi serovar Manhao 3 str. L 60]|uniref:Uncharacterized protein n=1 Tax=Leptospira alexanderi serovar Manhao 3 str. L 60 TaxID=1049759 RepID=V6I479_9LEPT|nr:hypothetical protein LEP1GSC062_0537 [Leptospira alexanderi serovar Manhao 3 str. L 60]
MFSENSFRISQIVGIPTAVFRRKLFMKRKNSHILKIKNMAIFGIDLFHESKIFKT